MANQTKNTPALFSDTIIFDADSLTNTLPSRISPFNSIPEPTYQPPDPTKKSHARKQPLGHIPRPRNAFILFRCDFVRQKKAATDEKDHRNISRIVGSVWREMSEAHKAPWVEMAEREKALHQRENPGYRYTPIGMPLKRRKRGDIENLDSGESEPTAQPRRSSSCPLRLNSSSFHQQGGMAPEQSKKATLLPQPLIDQASPLDSNVPLARRRRPSSCPPGTIPECPPNFIVPSQGSRTVERLSTAGLPLDLGTGPHSLHQPADNALWDIDATRWEMTSWDATGSSHVPIELQYFGITPSDLPPQGRPEEYNELLFNDAGTQHPPLFTNPFAKGSTPSTSTTRAPGRIQRANGLETSISFFLDSQHSSL